MMNIQAKDENEARQILLQAGIEFFREQAGYVPRIASKSECSLPRTRFSHARYTQIWMNEYQSFSVFEYWHTEEDLYATIKSIVVDMDICWSCKYKLENIFETIIINIPTLRNNKIGNCEICGDYYDSVPF